MLYWATLESALASVFLLGTSHILTMMNNFLRKLLICELCADKVRLLFNSCIVVWEAFLIKIRVVIVGKTSSNFEFLCLTTILGLQYTNMHIPCSGIYWPQTNTFFIEFMLMSPFSFSQKRIQRC